MVSMSEGRDRMGARRACCFSKTGRLLRIALHLECFEGLASGRDLQVEGVKLVLLTLKHVLDFRDILRNGDVVAI